MKKANILLPILQTATLKKKPREDELDHFVVYNKQFEDLKALYIDGFETLARLSVVFLAFYGIAQRGSTDVPTNKGSMTIWEFEKLPNANKANHLKGIPGESFWVRELDTAL